MHFKLLTLSLPVVTGLAFALSLTTVSAAKLHSFAFKGRDFMLDGKPYQIISGEIHFDRVPKMYWRHRIQMAKAMGCNTIATYVFWNNHEKREGVFDFESENRNLVDFIKIVQDEGLWMLLRPGPYCCGEWDFGGIPLYLLKYPDLKVRTLKDKHYTAAVERYIKYLSSMVEPYLVANGGPILMVQIENEYGSFGTEKAYMQWVLDTWKKTGIKTKFYTSDGATERMLENGTLPGCAVGLDPGNEQKNFDFARKKCPGVPIFSSETYPGWITHWGDEHFARQSAVWAVSYMMSKGLSFNLYVFGGGSNFGFTAGANGGGASIALDITCYDYGGPIDECGRPRKQYIELRDEIAKYPAGKNAKLTIPEPIPVMETAPIEMKPLTSIWDTKDKPLKIERPKAMEFMDQYYGIAIYETEIEGAVKGKLEFGMVNDFATVFVDGKFVGTIEHRLGQRSIVMPELPTGKHTLQVLVEAMGHVNFGHEMYGRKGLRKYARLAGKELLGWDVYRFPLESDYIKKLKPSKINLEMKGIFFRGELELDKPMDTYIDMSSYTKGIIWVNGYNLGRYWNIGPQHSLYCPANLLRKGRNEIIVLDLLQNEAKPIQGIKELK